MNAPRVPLYERLPEIYRTRDAEQAPPYPLRAYLGAVETVFDALHADIGQRYEDLFIDTCDDWVVPYLADLLGTSHLKGDPHTLRADVADTIALRRRKGTLAAIERLAFDLSGWACRAVELRENLAWTQHLNHQRPDAGGAPPLAARGITCLDAPRGGTLAVRDPRTLALLGGPFDSHACCADTRVPAEGQRVVNLPNLAVYLWRLADYRVPLLRPLAKGATERLTAPPGQARHALRFDLHPLDMPVQLFNTFRAVGTALEGGTPASLTQPDAVPGPIADARLGGDTGPAFEQAYAQVAYFDDSAETPGGFDLGDAGLQVFFPASLQALLLPLDGSAEWTWRWRGDNLCAWEAGLRRPLGSGEIVVDATLGRLLIGVDTAAQRDAVVDLSGAVPQALWFASYTYGAVGPVGAHPVDRAVTGPDAGGLVAEAELREVSALAGKTLQAALEDLHTLDHDVDVVILDSFTHPLDLSDLPGSLVDGRPTLRLNASLTIRAASGQRPVVALARALAFRPVDAATAGDRAPTVRLEGLYLAPDPAGALPDSALIVQAAVARLELIGCTLAPGGHTLRDGGRAPMQHALALGNDYGFASPAERDGFGPTPCVLLQRSVCGALAIDDRYRLVIESSIVDAGAGPGSGQAGAALRPAIAPHASGPDAWAAALSFDGLTCFGSVRTRQASGAGGLFLQRVQVFDDQSGCIRQSWFGATGNRLPAHHGCLSAAEAPLALGSARFNDAAYAQVARRSDERLRTLGPADDTMGAFGFLLEAHKWTNLQVRLREFMPLGVRPLIVPVT